MKNWTNERGHFCMQFSVSEFAGFKNKYVSINKILRKIALVPLTAGGGGLRKNPLRRFFLRALQNRSF